MTAVLPISPLEKAQKGLQDGTLTIDDKGKLVAAEQDENEGTWFRVPNRRMKRLYRQQHGEKQPFRSRCQRVRNRIRKEKFGR
ncbi:hypothetical protein J4U01_gp071 [Mycobacterium phage Kumao]|uniref:Uncharacterized protein n=1 Tax=Mycobacterium phage Kumao TaxID=2041344 RepID=A0A2D1GPV9_9CAUD|nr:hypothetical protein J4U01_gp071 [Mycobacterium phage Kumao]ATN94034.1 hypothetical protein SEA_KUMAO_71 [Mycobacterium phage Kumao]